MTHVIHVIEFNNFFCHKDYFSFNYMTIKCMIIFLYKTFKKKVKKKNMIHLWGWDNKSRSLIQRVKLHCFMFELNKRNRSSIKKRVKVYFFLKLRVRKSIKPTKKKTNNSLDVANYPVKLTTRVMNSIEFNDFFIIF